MIWDKLSVFYDAFENVYNGKVNRQLMNEITAYISDKDIVLECACGTGMLSVPIAKKCKKLLATDYSDGMLKQAKKKLKDYQNVKLARTDIRKLHYEDNRFDKVVAANVIHLLDSPDDAINELMRVCKVGGRIIIPTYVNAEKKEAGIAARLISIMGVKFKRQYDYESYQSFFKNLGYENIEYKLIQGRMPSAIAVISKQ
ncbi:MAG: class I SAM-dependent methyltransferase [Lachnospiraceae bacterium]|nr:class I SAM-dependent methyltransferase [Lachnospiraceae bacterium]